MKKLRLIEKRLEDNAQRVNQYASGVSTEKPYFDSDKEQTAEVAKLIQENTDLVHEYMRLKASIDRANLVVTIKYGNREYSLSDLLWLKRKLGHSLTDTYRNLNTNYADGRVRNAPKDAAGNPPVIVRYYDEKKKNENLLEIQTMLSEIDGRLEVMNSTTDIIE